MKALFLEFRVFLIHVFFTKYSTDTWNIIGFVTASKNRKPYTQICLGVSAYSTGILFSIHFLWFLSFYSIFPSDQNTKIVQSAVFSTQILHRPCLLSVIPDRKVKIINSETSSSPTKWIINFHCQHGQISHRSASFSSGQRGTGKQGRDFWFLLAGRAWDRILECWLTLKWMSCSTESSLTHLWGCAQLSHRALLPRKEKKFRIWDAETFTGFTFGLILFRCHPVVPLEPLLTTVQQVIWRLIVGMLFVRVSTDRLSGPYCHLVPSEGWYRFQCPLWPWLELTSGQEKMDWQMCKI